MRTRPASYSDSAFTLIEVLLSLAMMMMLLAALFFAIDTQSRHSDLVQERISEQEIARTLLHQIAEELRGLMEPIHRMQDPARARMLLSYGDVDLSEESVATAVTDQENPEIPIGTAERFALLGTPTRMIMMIRREYGATSLERYRQEEAETALPMSNAVDDKRREPSRWGNLRQVFYLPRPLPEALTREENIEAASEPTDGDEPVIHPYYGGVIRQEVLLPFSPDAQHEAFFQLKDHLFAKEDEGPALPEPPAPSEESQGPPLPPRLSTELLTDRITAIRFRYHDGLGWQSAWSKHDVLPIAVEISLSFEPAAADPEYLSERLEELAAMPQATEPGLTEPIEDPLFPYSLIVAISAARRPSAPPSSIPTPGDLPPEAPP